MLFRGKDSDVVLDLALKSGIDFIAQHNHTTADAPETVRHIREVFKKLDEQGYKTNITMPTYRGQRVSMWSLIPIKHTPPTRLIRYCCAILKEASSSHRVSITGVRRAESYSRSIEGEFTVRHRDKDKRLYLMHDDDDRRELLERCRIKSTINANPLVMWSNDEIKDYIESEHLNLCELYQCGFNRVGCVGCPMAGKKRNFEFQRYPKYRDMYIRAFGKMIEQRKIDGLESKAYWTSAMDVYHWWMEDGVLPGQMAIEGFE